MEDIKRHNKPGAYCTRSQFAKQVNVSERQVQRWMAEGVIPFAKIGKRCTRIPVKKALAAIEKLEVSV